MLKRPLILTSLALLTGVLLGFGLLYAENFVAKSLMGLLEHEVESAGPYKLEYDSADVSFLTFKGQARNARVVQDGKVLVTVANLRARFSLWKIFQRVATLEELKLNGASIEGVTPESAAFKVVNYIATPLPRPPGSLPPFMIDLRKLVLTSALASDSFGGKDANPVLDLKANGISLILQRNSAEEFELFANAQELMLVSRASGQPVLPLASVQDAKTSMLIAPDFVDIQKLSARFKGGSTSGSVFVNNKEGDLISGRISTSINDESLGLSKFAKAKIESETTLSGKAESPILNTKLSGQGLSFLNSLFAEQLSLSTLDGSLESIVSDKGLLAIFQYLSGTGDNLSIELEKPLRFSDGGLEGTIKAISQNLSSPYGEFKQITGRLILNKSAPFQISLEASAPANYPISKISSICNFILPTINCSINSDDNKLQANASIILRNSALPLLESSNIKFIGSLKPKTAASPNAANLDINASFSGPLAAELIEGIGKISILNAPVVQSQVLDLRVKEGALLISGKDHAKGIELEIKNAFGSDGITTVKLNAKKLPLSSRVDPEKSDCSSTSFTSHLNFPGLNFSATSGNISVASLDLGCAPYAINLKKPAVLTVTKGSLFIPAVIFNSAAGELMVDGRISSNEGYNLAASGRADLSALLPFTREIDELSGKLRIDLNISGPFSKPQLRGRAEILSTRLEIESPSIEISECKGYAILDNRTILLKEFGGNVNGGKFNALGTINIDNLTASDLRLNFYNMVSNPLPEAEFVSSGALFLANPGFLANAGAPQPIIGGNIEVHSAQITKRVDFLKLARETSQKLIGLGTKKIEFSASARESPIKLNLKINAPSSVFFDSNFAQAEAKARLQITGPALSPAIEGQIELIKGWFGLKDRRFDISSGKIIFYPDRQDPELEILAETSVFTRQGENAVIFASIKGPVTAPQVRLDSDKGYTEREIVQLITSVSDVFSTEKSMGMDVEVPFVSDDSLFGLGRWIRRLTKIDSLSIEPSFNSQSGAIEPTLVAEKYLGPNLTLRAENSFGSSGNDSRLRVNYNLSQRVVVSGLIDALASQENTALGFDVSYAFKPKGSKTLSTRVNGNQVFSSEKILNHLKINEESRIEPERVSRLRETLISLYNDNGFPGVSAEIECEEDPNLGRCLHLDIRIAEGERLTVDRIESEGDFLPQKVSAWLIDQKEKIGGQTATKALREQLAYSLIARLRNEGYIRARVNSFYKENLNPTILFLSVETGSPVTFIFQGNQAFSNESLLSTINLFGRRQPFGNNTINLLTTNIERLYNQSGYPYASVSWSSSNEGSAERTIYLVEINEGAKIELEGVEFEGISAEEEKSLKKNLYKMGPEIYASINSPINIVPDLVDQSCRIIQSALIYAGFMDAQVKYRVISKATQRQKATIVYEISAGQQKSAKHLFLNDMPDDIEVDFPEAPFSEKKIELFREDLLKNLRIAGYRNALIESSQKNDSIELRVVKGKPTTIGKLEFQGLEDIAQSVVESKLEVHENELWNEDKIAKSRQSILRTGLFKRVEIRPKDGLFDSETEDATIFLEERNLTSMQIGAGANSEYGLHIFGLVTDRGVFADGRSIAGRVDTYFDRLKGQISQGIMSLNYTDPDLMQDPLVGYVSDLRFQRLNQSSLEFNLDRVSHSGYLHKNFNENISASLGHTFLVERLDNVDSNAVLNPDFDTGTVRIGYLQGNAIFDFRDNPLTPRNGYAFALSPQIAADAFGSEANFAGLDIHFTKILPLEGRLERFSFAYSARAASEWAYGGSNFVPISQRYYLGGRSSVRGFRENSLGPKASDGTIIGGDELLTQSLELRYLVMEDTSLNLFLDSGRLQLKDYAADGEQMRYSTGAGVRYLSPIGPVGFDVGFPLNEQSGEPSVRFHFNIGSNF